MKHDFEFIPNQPNVHFSGAHWLAMSVVRGWDLVDETDTYFDASDRLLRMAGIVHSGLKVLDRPLREVVIDAAAGLKQQPPRLSRDVIEAVRRVLIRECVA